MASASITARPTPATVTAYFAAGHTTAEAVAYFGVSDSYLRRLKRMAAERDNSDIIRVIQGDVVTLSSPYVISSAPQRHARIYDTPRIVHHAAVAHGHELWWCNHCNDYMHPLPGTTGHVWNAHGCYLHTAEPEPGPEPTPPAVHGVPEPEPPQRTAQSQRNTEPAAPRRAERVPVPPADANSQPLPYSHESPTSDNSARPLSETAITQPGPAPSTNQPTNEVLRSTTLVDRPPRIVRQVVYRTVEPQRAGLLPWLNERPELRNMLLAVVAAVILILISRLG